VIDWSAYPEYDENVGWKLTLPPPKRGEAWVEPIIVAGSELRWACHWMSGGIGGSCYTMPLPRALESVGRFLIDMRRIFG
jgi:hypothetical protein